MITKESIRGEISKIIDNETKLYSYLYDLIYNEVTSDIAFLESIYAPFLKDERSEIKRVAIYSLLFGLKLRKEEYRDFAFKYMSDSLSDFELRLTCISGISQAFLKSRDRFVLRELNGNYLNINEDEDIRAECFVALLKVLGLSAKEITTKNKRVIVAFSDINLDEFSIELEEIKRIVKD